MNDRVGTTAAPSMQVNGENNQIGPYKIREQIGEGGMTASANGYVAIVREEAVDVMKSRNVRRTLSFEGKISGQKPIQFSSCGRYLALALTECVVIWDFSGNTAEPSRVDLPTHSNPVSALAFAFDRSPLMQEEPPARFATNTLLNQNNTHLFDFHSHTHHIAISRTESCRPLAFEFLSIGRLATFLSGDPCSLANPESVQDNSWLVCVLKVSRIGYRGGGGLRQTFQVTAFGREAYFQLAD